MNLPQLKSRQKHSGFSFLEVLLALALFALASAILTTSLTTALILRERGDVMEPVAYAIQLAREQLLLEPTIGDAERGAEIDLPFGGRIRWRTVIEPTEIVNLFAIELTISIDGLDSHSDGEHVQQLWLLRPTWSLSEERNALLDEKRRLIESERAFSSTRMRATP
jgi:prepilin-type N-terminal cleavage/methylation domain-containing protein